MGINPGDIYWLKPDDQGPIHHPQLVIRDHSLSDSSRTTVLTCELTSNVKRVSLPGNVLLDPGEGNLDRQSVVQVGKLATVEKSALGVYIGSLSAARMDQILSGIRFLERAYYPR